MAIFTQNYIFLVLDKIIRNHREANAEIEPKKTVLRELKRVEQYSDIFSVGKERTVMKLQEHELVTDENVKILV